MIDFPLYLITDRKQIAEGLTFFSAIEAALKGGVKAIQLREKDLSDPELLPIAQELRTLTRSFNAKLLINDRIDVALAVEADGVHLAGHSMPTDVVRQRIGHKLLIGVSTHSQAEVELAAKQGADFVTFGPVYATPSKAVYGPPLGLQALTNVCANSQLPVFALGGITAQRAPCCLGVGARGVALISAIIASPDPEQAAQAFLA